MSNRRVRNSTVSMGLRWKTVKGRAHPLTRLSLDTLASSCWTELSERAEGKRERIERVKRKRERKREQMGDKRYLHRGRGRRKRRSARETRDEIKGGNWGSVGEPSSARNRSTGKRDTTGRLHYRAPTCFLSLRRRGLFTLASRPPSRVSSLSSPEPADSSVRYTNPFHRFSLLHLRSLDPILYQLGYACSLDSVKRAIPRVRWNYPEDRVSCVKRREYSMGEFRVVKRCRLKDEDTVAWDFSAQYPASFYGTGCA